MGRCIIIMVGALVVLWHGAHITNALHFHPPSTCDADAAPPARRPTTLSADQVAQLQRILPQPTVSWARSRCLSLRGCLNERALVQSSGVAARAELRAPLHIPCQVRDFPHLVTFRDHAGAMQLSNLEVIS
ncbi:TPA: hypothetical protein N0F65_000637 [Lagenidium giganteum]|uniref:Uncharacterized protein n=1 Tax=Lagenidium giganteum TaxID=4803 RepID=A0AAV2YTZ9_9STRA|nr:TPA: hypothetical protein N0F65_000637 [Lagenidium giganteum]